MSTIPHTVKDNLATPGNPNKLRWLIMTAVLVVLGFFIFLVKPALGADGDYYINQDQTHSNTQKEYIVQSFTTITDWKVRAIQVHANAQPTTTIYLCSGTPSESTIEAWTADCIASPLVESDSWHDTFSPFYEADLGGVYTLIDDTTYSFVLSYGVWGTINVNIATFDEYPLGRAYLCFENDSCNPEWYELAFRVVEGEGLTATIIEPVSQVYNSLTAPIYITSNLDEDIIAPIFSLQIRDNNDNQLYFWSDQANPDKVGGYWVYNSSTAGLPDGDYKISAYVYSVDQDEYSDWSSEVVFTILAPSGGGGTSWGDELEEPTYTDSDFGLIGNWFRDVLLFLFLPSTDQMGNITILQDKLKGIVPIRYFFDLKEAWDSASKEAGEPPTFSLETNFGAITVFDGAGIVELFGASNWTLVKDSAKVFIYLSALAYLFFRLIRPMFKL